MSQISYVHNYFDRAANGLKLIVRMPVESKGKDKEEEMTSICVEWRVLPEKLSRALNSGSHLRDKPTTNKPLPLCLINLDSEGLAECLARELNSPCGDTLELGNGRTCVYDKLGRRIVSGRRFDIPAFTEDVPNTMSALKMSWLTLQLTSISGTAGYINQLSDGPREDWDKANLSYTTTCAKNISRELDAAGFRFREHTPVDLVSPEAPKSEDKDPNVPANNTKVEGDDISISPEKKESQADDAATSL